MNLHGRKIVLHDMCLRDGMHPKRHQISVEQMVKVATALDAAGVPLIEVTHGDGLGGASINYGFPLHSDEEYLRAVVPSEPGEILVRSPAVMRGYLDDPVATAQAIDAQGWLHTGDVGTIDARGYLRITDRKKDTYISGGLNCYPAEIEKILCNHPAVQTAAVIGLPDARLGEVGKAFVVLRPGMIIDGGEIIAWARTVMANYKVPRAVELVSELPRNAAGKVLRTQLRVLERAT
jgi:acyl-CoA synthetase (AMP-forming)/AMP-acid ligase II